MVLMRCTASLKEVRMRLWIITVIGLILAGCASNEVKPNRAPASIPQGLSSEAEALYAQNQLRSYVYATKNQDYK